MVQLNKPFEQAAVKDDFAVLPPAPYTLAITKTDKKPTKASPEISYYMLEMDVQGGEFQGRKIFENLNLESTNDQARNIAEKTLKRIAEAVGVVVTTDLDCLIGKPFIGHVAVKAGDNGYADKNVVKKYEAMPSHAQPTKAPQWPGAK